MVFSSSVFLLIFAPVVLIVYYILPAKLRNFGLLTASLVFYAWGEPIYICIMLFSAVFDYTNGLLLEKFSDNKKVKKIILTISIVVNIGLMCLFKYTNFAIETLNSVFNIGLNLLNITLPIGISFYTFQTMSYTIDVYRGNIKAQHNIISFGMYVSMFPQLIAGPIVRYADIKDSINDRKIDINQISDGIFRFIFGLAKKVLIANQVGLLWNEISHSANIPTLTAWIGAAAFMFQIYFDFSGYSDMAIGLGKMLGFEFPENFRYPYEAESVTEFWRRWHITLGTWFREYVYIPLGGNRKGTLRQIFNLFTVWLLTGLWHGAGFNFILWGLYFFALLVIEKTILKKFLKKVPKPIRHLYTLLAILFSWVIFACDDALLLKNYIFSLFGANGYMNSMSLYYLKTNSFLLILCAVLSTSIVKKCIEKIKLPYAVKAAAAICIYIICTAFVAVDSYNPFLYFRF